AARRRRCAHGPRCDTALSGHPRKGAQDPRHRLTTASRAGRQDGMIERVQLLKLRPEHATPEGRTEVVEQALSVLSRVPGVLGVTAGVPPDADAAKSWGVLISLRFAAFDELVSSSPDAAHPPVVYASFSAPVR